MRRGDLDRGDGFGDSAAGGCAAVGRTQSGLRRALARRSVMDMKLPNYSTNGFWQTVPWSASGPGWMEVQHFYNGGIGPAPDYVAGGGVTMNWRIPVATDYPMRNVTVTFSLPSPTGSPVV